MKCEPSVIRGTLIGRNAVLNLIGLGLPLVVAAIVVPQLIRTLGTERFGIMALGWTVAGYFTVIDLGLGPAVTKFVSGALGRGDQEEIPAVTWTSVIIQIVLGMVGASALAVAAPLLVHRVLNVPADLVAEAQSAFTVIALSVPIMLISGSFRGVLEAAQHFGIVNAVRGPVSAANYLLPLLGASLGWDLSGIFALIVTSRFVALFLFFTASLRLFPSMAVPQFRWSVVPRLLRFGGWVTVSNTVAPVLVYLDRFLLGALVTLSTVSYYVAPYEMVTRLLIVSSGLSSALFPAMSTLHEQGQSCRLEYLLFRSTKYLLLVLAPLVLTGVVFARDIMAVWLGSEFVEDTVIVFQVLMVGMLLNSLATQPFTLVQATGHPELGAKIHLLEVPIHIILTFGLVRLWGISGAAIAWTIRVTLDTLLLFVVAFRISRVSIQSLLSSKVPHTIAMFVITGALALLLNMKIESFWLRALVLTMVFAALTLGTWHHLTDSADRRQISKILHTIEGKLF